MSKPERITGRNVKLVDWKRVDELLMAGCNGTEICPHFDMHHDTFYRKVEEKFGISFTAYSALKKNKGDSLLREKQFEKALQGDNTMMVWLGKNRLGQKDTHDAPTVPNHNDLKELIKEIKSSMDTNADKPKTDPEHPASE